MPGCFIGRRVINRELNAYDWKWCAESESTGRRGKGDPSRQDMAPQGFGEGVVADGITNHPR